MSARFSRRRVLAAMAGGLASASAAVVVTTARSEPMSIPDFIRECDAIGYVHTLYRDTNYDVVALGVAYPRDGDRKAKRERFYELKRLAGMPNGGNREDEIIEYLRRQTRPVFAFRVSVEGRRS